MKNRCVKIWPCIKSYFCIDLKNIKKVLNWNNWNSNWNFRNVIIYVKYSPSWLCFPTTIFWYLRSLSSLAQSHVKPSMEIELTVVVMRWRCRLYDYTKLESFVFKFTFYLTPDFVLYSRPVGAVLSYRSLVRCVDITLRLWCARGCPKVNSLVHLSSLMTYKLEVIT